jgi:hypothetical protein
VVQLKDVPIQEIPTKNRRVRTIAVDELTVMIIRAQLAHMEEHAAFAGVALDS